MKVSKSGLFLFELIVVIFLFTVSSAVCINIFAKSYTFSTDSENLTMASLKADTVAEVFKESDGDADAILVALGANDDTHDMVMASGDSNQENFTLNVYYDNEWNNTDEKNKTYVLSLEKKSSTQTQNNNILRGEIHIKSDKGSIFQMNVDKFLTSKEREDKGE